MTMCRLWAGVAAGCLSVASMTSAAATYVGRDLYTFQLPSGTSFITSIQAAAAVIPEQVAATAAINGNRHALIWNNSSISVDLTPAGAVASLVYGTDGNHQFGSATTSAEHAILWNGSASNYTDLNPAFINSIGSRGFAVRGNQQGGEVFFNNGTYHAVLWNGTAASAIDLNPSTVTRSAINAISANQQVGSATSGSNFHAALWSGSAASYIDLHPGSSYSDSYAYATNDTQQVGNAFLTSANNFHAILWTGSSDSAVELFAGGSFRSSTAIGLNATTQVGYGYLTGGNISHALLWQGSAASQVDLQSLLPAGFTSSAACSIDAAGNIYGYAVDSSGQYHAVQWVPEPGGLVLAGGVALLAQRRRRRRRVLKSIKAQP